MQKEIDVEIVPSSGKSSKRVCYVRPLKYCFNRSRRVVGFDAKDLADKLAVTIEKYYTPMNYYTVNGETIGSNNERNALTEYYRVCSKEDQDKIFEVTKL